MSARSWSGHPPRGGGRLEERPLAGVPGQEPPLVADAQGCVRELVHEDGTADVVHAVAAGWELKHEPLEAHGVVVAHQAFMLAREQEAEIDPGKAHERAGGLRGLDREAAVKVGEEGRGEIRVGGSVVGNPRHAELRGEAALERPEVPLTAAPGFRGAGADVPDAEGLEGTADLRVVGVFWRRAGDRRAAKMTAAVRVARGEPAVRAQHVVEGVERRGRALLVPEAAGEDAAVGVVERHDEVARGEAGNPGMRRAVEVDEHADHRPALALAAVAAAARGLRRQARGLQDEPRPGVRELEAVLLRGLRPEVLEGEVRVALAAQPTQARDHRHGDPAAPRRAAPLVLEAIVDALLPGAFYAPQVPRRQAENVRRLQPGELAVDRLHDHLLARHRPDLPGHLPPHVLHGTGVAVRADIFECLWSGHLQCVPHSSCRGWRRRRERAKQPDMRNAELARVFRDLAAYLEMDDVPFKPRAYEKAAQAIESHDRPLTEVYRAGGEKALREIPGIGKSMAEKLVELITTGTCALHADYRRRMPVDLAGLTAIEGVGPKAVKALYERLGVRTVADLEAAARAGKIRTLPHFGEKSEERILKALAAARASAGRRPLCVVLPQVEEIAAALGRLAGVSQVAIAGSIRRRR